MAQVKYLLAPPKAIIKEFQRRDIPITRCKMIDFAPGYHYSPESDMWCQLTEGFDGFSVVIKNHQPQPPSIFQMQSFWTHYYQIERRYDKKLSRYVIDLGNSYLFDVDRKGDIYVRKNHYHIFGGPGVFCDQDGKVYWPSQSKGLDRLLPLCPSIKEDEENHRHFIKCQVAKGYCPLGTIHGMPQFIV